jgi:hypothetical protein
MVLTPRSRSIYRREREREKERERVISSLVEG